MIVQSGMSKNLLSKILIGSLVIGCLMFGSATAQTSVPTTAQNKNFLIEKGTGHVCGSCPSLDLKCDTVIATHPGRGMLILYHFGPDAVPQASPLDGDFTTPYGDTIYDPAKLNWPFYLNMMVNRRDQGSPYGSTFIFGATNQVQAEADLVVTQASPVNLSMSSTYNSATRLLTVHVEGYYTAASSTTMNYIQIALTEDSIVATQYDPAYAASGHFNPNYVHMNVFRANLNGFAGDTVSTTTTGSYFSRTYTYTIPTTYKNIACNPQHCNLTYYIAEQKAASGVQSFTGKVITAIRTKVGGSTTTGIEQEVTHNTEIVYPNPTRGIAYIKGIEPGSYSIDVTDMMGKRIYSTTGSTSNAKIDLSSYPKGLYFIRINSPNTTNTHKIMLVD